MFDVAVTLCLLAATDVCADRIVPVGATDCESALQAAAPRLEEWSVSHLLDGIDCIAPNADALALTKVGPGLYVHTGAIAEPGPGNAGDISNLVIVVGEERVAVIDAGGSRAVGERAVAAVRDVTDLPIAWVILTHMHPDHVFGATALVDAGAEVVGHHALPQALAARADSYETAFLRLVGPAFVGTRTPVPTRLIDAAEVLDLGGRTLRLQSWPTAHTPTDLTVLDETTGILVAGDLVFDMHVPALDGSLRGWQTALDALDGMAPSRVVPGHGPAILPWPEGGVALRRYLDTLARDTRAAIETGLTLGEAVETVAQGEAGEWALFEAYNARNATVAYTELEWE